MEFNALDIQAVTAIRTLSLDAIDKANSGHPGLPLGAAPMAYALWSQALLVNPGNPQWENRDRFVLSAGHGSMLLYSLLHLSGFDVTLEDLQQFRQLGSRTPGHPEVGHTDGVEATTGPLGQGVAMAVGMALAERHLAGLYNKDSFPVVDHYTYCLCGDGDLMEGVANEAISHAGHEQLDKLIMLYDSNDISLDGELSLSFSENIKQRFEASGWQHLLVTDGNDLAEITAAIELARENHTEPTIIEVKTVIGFGSPHAGTHKVHGSPLGEAGSAAAKLSYQWAFPAFTVPDQVYAHFREKVADRGAKAEADWQVLMADYEYNYPELAKQFKDSHRHVLPDEWYKLLENYGASSSKAGRDTSSDILNLLAQQVPYLFGGSADLASSNKTLIAGDGRFSKSDPAARNIWFGVREFAMGAEMNGIALHGGLRIYGGTFFVFSDYLKAAIRLAALQQLPVIYILTHDSIIVGEDGPTHEPVEQLAGLRAMPNLNVIRPADGNEVTAAWHVAMTSSSTPTILVLTRQALPILKGSLEKAPEGVKRGGYVLSPASTNIPDLILIASGSEVELAIKAQSILENDGISTSVVSLPNTSAFDKQDEAYKESVLPKAVRARVGVEMGASFGWERYIGLDGKILAIDRFGASGKGSEVVAAYGFTVDKVVALAKEVHASMEQSME
ncbi:transketolase [Paenibacillus albidus]|uniref:transketolase n=1 Tax=Paenibacillus albidus TaxID=2041023 RepID=UPI001BE66A50|nr:transketolase [Paenibacillus albidus]MBT2292849.1 transketolase [Paenibacillus albidus]